jgi:hypothetical protein
MYLPLPFRSSFYVIRRVPGFDAVSAEQRYDFAFDEFVIQRGMADEDERHVEKLIIVKRIIKQYSAAPADLSFPPVPKLNKAKLIG